MGVNESSTVDAAMLLDIAGFRFSFEGESLVHFLTSMRAYAPFWDKLESAATSPSSLTLSGRGLSSDEFDSAATPDFRIVADLQPVQLPEKGFFATSYETVECDFFKSGRDIFFRMVDSASGAHLYERWTVGEKTVHITDTLTPSLCRYALWTAVNFLLSGSLCHAVHSSANVFPPSVTGLPNPVAVICLGESGTGKSTHTSLMRQYCKDSFLLNDDSPFVRFDPESGRVMVYGSPWSGKTPCYKNECYPLYAVVRLSQAPHNRITRLSAIPSIAALLPSMPPVLGKIDECNDGVCDLVSGIVNNVPVYHLECLPDVDAARLSVSTIFGKPVSNNR